MNKRRTPLVFGAALAVVACSPGSGSASDSAACPSTAPKVGTSCTRHKGCGYDYCGSNIAFECVSGKWQQSVYAQCYAPPDCPKTTPANGTPCSLPSVSICSWGDPCNGVTTTTGSCDGNVWTITYNCINDAGAD
jgi:hypothetical protein